MAVIPASRGEDQASGPQSLPDFRLEIVDTQAWLNKRWQIAGSIDIWPKLAHGRWAVVLHSLSCGHCGPVLEEYTALASRWQSARKPLRVAVLEMADAFSPPETVQNPLPAPVLTGTFSTPANGFLVSPTLVLLVEGKVIAVEEGAVNCSWSVQKEALLKR